MHNRAATYGGGINVVSSGEVTMSDSSVAFNTASRAGGGIWTTGAVFTVHSSNVTHNRAEGASGGGLFISSKTAFNATDMNVEANEVSGSVSFVNVTKGNCFVKGNCFYSPNYPLDYAKGDVCEFVVLSDTVLYAVEFDTVTGADFLTIDGTFYSGTQGPSDVGVSAGSTIAFVTHDGNAVASGFGVCQSANGNTHSLNLSSVHFSLNARIPTYFSNRRGALC